MAANLTANMNVTDTQEDDSWDIDRATDGELVEPGYHDVVADNDREGLKLGFALSHPTANAKAESIESDDLKQDQWLQNDLDALDNFVIQQQISLTNQAQRQLKRCIGAATDNNKLSTVAEMILLLVKQGVPELLDQLQAAGLKLDLQRKEALQTSGSRLEGLKQELKKTKQSSNDCIADLKGKLVARDRTIEEHKQMIRGLSADLQTAGDTNKELERRMSGLEVSLKEMTQLKAGADAKIETAKKIKDLELKNKNTELVSVKADREEWRQKAQDRFEKLEDTKKTLNFVSRIRDIEVEWRNKTQDENSKLQDRLREAAKTEKADKNALSKAEQKIAELEARTRQMEQAAATFASQKEELQASLRTKNGTITNQSTTIGEKKDIIKSMLEEETRKGQENLRMQADLRAKISELQSSNRDAVDKAKAKLQTSNAQVSGLEEKLRDTSDNKISLQIKLTEVQTTLDNLREQQKFASADSSASSIAKDELLKEYQKSRDAALLQSNQWASITLRCLLADPEWKAHVTFMDSAIPLQYVKAIQGAGEIANKADEWLTDLVGCEIVVEAPPFAEITALRCWYDSYRAPTTLDHRALHTMVSSLATRPAVIPIVLGFIEAALEQMAKFEDPWSRDNALFALRGLELICRFHRGANFPGFSRLRQIYDRIQPRVGPACKISRLVRGFNDWVGDLVKDVSSSLIDRLLTRAGEEACVFDVDDATWLLSDDTDMILLQRDGPTRYCSQDNWKLRYVVNKGWEVTLFESGREVRKLSWGDTWQKVELFFAVFPAAIF
jgi:hypothetical protein